MSKTHMSFVNEIFYVKHLLGTVEWRCYHKGVTQLHVEDFWLILTSPLKYLGTLKFFIQISLFLPNTVCSLVCLFHSNFQFDSSKHTKYLS